MDKIMTEATLGDALDKVKDEYYERLDEPTTEQLASIRELIRAYPYSGQAVNQPSYIFAKGTHPLVQYAANNQWTRVTGVPSPYVPWAIAEANQLIDNLEHQLYLMRNYDVVSQVDDHEFVLGDGSHLLILDDNFYKMSDVFPSTYTSMTTISVKLDTYGVTKLDEMFKGCTSLTTVPEFDTSNATSMRYMFQNCSSLPATFPWKINLTGIDKQSYWVISSSGSDNVMYRMFNGSSVTSVTFQTPNHGYANENYINYSKIKGSSMTITFEQI